MAKVSEFGPDTDMVAGASYLSWRKAGRKFAILQVTAERLDIAPKHRRNQVKVEGRPDG